MSRRIGQLIGHGISPIVESLDVNAIVNEIDLDELVERIDMDKLVSVLVLDGRRLRTVILERKDSFFHSTCLSSFPRSSLFCCGRWIGLM